MTNEESNPKTERLVSNAPPIPQARKASSAKGRDRKCRGVGAAVNEKRQKGQPHSTTLARRSAYLSILARECACLFWRFWFDAGRSSQSRLDGSFRAMLPSSFGFGVRRKSSFIPWKSAYLLGRHRQAARVE